MDTTQILYLAGAFLLGFIIAWFAGRGGPKRAAEEAAAETESVRRKLSTAEGDLRKTQGQLKENLATLDQLNAEKDNLVKVLRSSEQGLSDASAELSRLNDELSGERDARLLLETELSQARGALGESREQASELNARLNAMTEIAEEVEEALVAETTALSERIEADEDLVTRINDLENELAVARATSDRLVERSAIAAAELMVRRREYGDIVDGGPDMVMAALAARDRALTDTQTQLDYMKRDLSMLTSAGAQMAAALETRENEYGILLNRLAGESAARALPEVSAAAAPKPAEPEALVAADGPDPVVELAMLKSEHDRLSASLENTLAERDGLQGKLAELNEKLEAAGADLSALAAEKENLLANLEARSAVISGVLAKIGGFDEELRSILAGVAVTAQNGADDGSSESAPLASADEAVASEAAEGEKGETDAS